MFSWFLRSLTRGSLRLSFVTLHITRAADFAGLLAWRSSLPATFPRRRPLIQKVIERKSLLRVREPFAAVACPLHSECDQQRDRLPALQSRGGDGFSFECNRIAVARLPE